MCILVLISIVSAAFGPLIPQGDVSEGGCAVRSYVMRSDVHLRYATTLLQVRVANPSRRRHAPRCLLRVVVPEAAFVSGLLVEVGNTVLQSVVTVRGTKELQVQPETVEDEDLLDTFRVPRDSKLLRATVSLAPREEATLYVTYEQLLTRRLGIYEVVLNLHPGQVVPDLRAEVYLHESHEFAVVRVPGLRTGHEIDPLEVQSEFPLAKVRRPSAHAAHVLFAPTPEQQAQMANSRSWINDPRSRTRNEGISGQLVFDGFFAHHYAPTALSVLPKHVVFVLDLSSSMEGRKIQQLKTAMVAILDELRPGDFFSIIQFNSFKSVWSPDGKMNKKRNKGSPNKQGGGRRVVPVTPRYIAKAKRYISQLKAMGATSPLSLVVLLTDGETTVGESEPARILQAVRAANRNSNNTRQIPVYSLAFGVEADFPFLRRLSAENFGSSRRIYNSDDAALQLHEVFAELSSPVLADLTFRYPETVVIPESLTQHRFAAAYLGSELVVAGRVHANTSHVEAPDGTKTEMWGEVQGRDSGEIKSTVHLPQSTQEVPGMSHLLLPPLSRLWAYLTVQQLLLGGASSPDSRQKATELALEYSFVTATTTLSLRAEGGQPVNDDLVTVMLPASQEVGSEGRGRGHGDDACSEGGEGEYWFPLQQAFIPCATTPIWLPEKRYEGRYLVLPKGRAGADQLFWLGLNQTNLPHAPCFSPINEPSHCRHLHFCPLQEFADNYHYFLNFFCAIHHNVVEWDISLGCVVRDYRFGDNAFESEP
ncbi:hypothetical protein B566_EDAN002783, partial [Ephemera danica]